MPARFRKQDLKDELLARLTAELEALERAHKQTTAGATHEEAKPENDKDTRALEQSYLARGQAQRVETERQGVAEVAALAVRAFGEVDPVALGALVVVEEDDKTQAFFVAPHGGGTRLSGGAVQVVTPKSPLGAALLGKRSGDDVEATVGGRIRELAILDVY